MTDISHDTRELLKSGLDDLQEYKKKEEEKRKKEAEEIEAGQEYEGTLEVVESRMVRQGEGYLRCERLVPSLSSTEPRTFDPRARPSVGTLSSSVDGRSAFDEPRIAR